MTASTNPFTEASILARADQLAKLTQLSYDRAKSLLHHGDIPVDTITDITHLVNTYGAAVNPYNKERSWVRSSASLDALSTALPAHITGVRGLTYQYCDLCNGKVHGSDKMRVQAFFTATPLDTIVENAIRCSFPEAHVVYIEHADCHRVTMRKGAYRETFTPYKAALWAYSLHESSLHERHDCMLGRTASEELHNGHETARFVNIESYAPGDPSLDMRVSSLLRCPNQPTRHLDIDMLLFDRRTLSVAGVVEHAHMGHKRNPSDTDAQDRDKCWKEVQSKPTTKTRDVALRFRCTAYRVIDHERLGTVVHRLNAQGDEQLEGIAGLIQNLS